MNQIARWFVLMLCVVFFDIHAGQVAIVIDDIGYKQSDRKLLELNGQLTYAILPHTPLGFEYAQHASKNNRDVIIHLPMQAKSNNHLLGPGSLTQSMSKQTYQRTLLAALEDIPFAVGVNNHMGSLLTQQEQPMAWTMELLRQHNMFFLDSKTTKFSKIAKMAKRYGVSSLNRNVFLDHDRDKKIIQRQFDRLIRIAKRHGSAVAIGHPYPETYQVLKQNIDKLKAHGVELVPISQLVQNPPEPYYYTQHVPASDKPAPATESEPVAEVINRY